MRVVKYRAKVLNSNNWIYRQPFHIRGTWYMYNSLWDKVPINYKTLGQYTGLKGKNSKEIYEGDIVETVCDGRTFIGIVVYDLDELGFKATNGKENYGSNFQYLTCCEEVEVIGNIFEDGELLNDSK